MKIINALGTRGGRYVDVSDKQRRRELMAALHRALNTWTFPPKWLVQLYDELKEEERNERRDNQASDPRRG